MNSTQINYDPLFCSPIRDQMEALRQSELFQKNPIYENLLTEFVTNEGVQERNLPCASRLVPIHAGICLPGMDVFTYENRSWYGIFRMDYTLKTSGFPAELMYPPGTRIDTALQVYYDGCRDFVLTSSAVFLKREQADSLPLLQIKQSVENPFRKNASVISSDKTAFANPSQWFESLDTFTYGIIKVTVPDTRSYAERTRSRLQSALDKIEGTPLDKLLFLQEELKVSYSLRVKFSVRDDYHQACLKLREYKRQVYAFLHNMDLDDPEQIYAFAERGNTMKRLQMRVETKRWILVRTPEAEKCMTRPVNLRKNGAVGLWYEDPKNGLLCTMHASLRDKKIYYKPPVFPKIAEVPAGLDTVYVTIRGGALIRLNL